MPREVTAKLAVLALLVAACTGSAGATAVPTPPAQPGPAAEATPTAPATPANPPTQAPAGTPPAGHGQPSLTASPAASPTPTFDPGGLTLAFEPFATGLGQLTYLTNAGDGSGLFYAVEQEGVVRVVERDGAARPQPFLDIRDRVRAGGERGLLGLAFHPDYADNGRLFAHYTDLDGNTVVSEFTRSAEAVADPASERPLFTLEQPFANHNGGMVVFGPDGYLYISLGDGGGAGDPLNAGQDLGAPLGSILRIDVDSPAEAERAYAIPPDNPFVGRPDARAEIWAWGLRNPWRMSFDRQSGALTIADVGQNAWEEINVQPVGQGGLNYGWNVMEGPDCFRAETCDSSGLVLPVAWYARDAGHCAVVGGYAYRGSQFPELNGAYLYADYCSGLVWGLDLATALDEGRASPHELGSAGLQPTAFGEDEDGELYLVGHSGEILRIVARPN